MKYYKITYSNGYAGRQREEFVSEEEIGTSIEEYYEDGMDCYPFFDPDDRFCDTDNQEEIDFYQENCWEYSGWKEISEREYLNGKNTF